MLLEEGLEQPRFLGSTQAVEDNCLGITDSHSETGESIDNEGHVFKS